jgi:hypothetical protein
MKRKSNEYSEYEEILKHYSKLKKRKFDKSLETYKHRFEYLEKIRVKHEKEEYRVIKNIWMNYYLKFLKNISNLEGYQINSNIQYVNASLKLDLNNQKRNFQYIKDHSKEGVSYVIKDFLKRDEKFLLVIGDPGVGKTRFCKLALKTLVDQIEVDLNDTGTLFDNDSSSVPLFFELKRLYNSETIYSSILNYYKFNMVPEKALNILFEKPMVLILDGFDEVVLKKNQDFKFFECIKRSNVHKVIISCRSNKRAKLENILNDLKICKKKSVLYLNVLRFRENERNKFIKENATDGELLIKELKNDENKDLSDILLNQHLLQIFIECNLSSEFIKKKITRTEIYDEFVHSSIIKFTYNHDEVIENILKVENICCDLAKLFFLDQKKFKIKDKDFMTKDEKKLYADIFSSGTPNFFIVVKEDTVEFINDSFYSFFMAKFLYKLYINMYQFGSTTFNPEILKDEQSKKTSYFLNNKTYYLETRDFFVEMFDKDKEGFQKKTLFESGSKFIFYVMCFDFFNKK